MELSFLADGSSFRGGMLLSGEGCTVSRDDTRSTPVLRREQFHLSRRIFPLCYKDSDRLCGLLVRVPGYRSRGPVLDSRRYQIL
jgi:hypothetical protein